MQKLGFLFFFLSFSLFASAQVISPKSSPKLEKMTPKEGTTKVVERNGYLQPAIQTKDVPNPKQLIKEGDDLQKQGKYADAYSSYNKAYELKADQTTKQKMNRCLQALGVPVK